MKGPGKIKLRLKQHVPAVSALLMYPAGACSVVKICNPLSGEIIFKEGKGNPEALRDLYDIEIIHSTVS